VRNGLKLGVLFGLLVGTSAHAADEASVAAGKQIFNRCAVCHAIGPNAVNKIGPELNGIIGRQAGSLSDFNYSASMREAGIRWDDKTIANFIRNPRAAVSGTKMMFPGIKDETDVANVVAFLGTFSADGSSR
jgi:cytochrome c2